MAPPFPSPVPTWHNNLYSAIYPSKNLQSHEGKTVIITGAVAMRSRRAEDCGCCGGWDILVLNAGYMPTPSPAANADIEDYWKAYKSVVIFAKSFFPTANPEKISVLGVISGSALLPAFVGLSAYQSSKLALIKTMECLSVENPNIFCPAVHPGLVDTDVLRKSGVTPDALPMDDVQLPGCFEIWLSLPEAQFLNGKHVWVNWDMDELKSKAKEIASG